MATVEQRIRWEVDSRSKREAEAGLEDVKRRQMAVEKAFADGALELREYRSEIDKLTKEAREFNRVLDELEQPRDIDIRTERFDAVSREVGLAGDVQSNLGAISGLAGAFGAGGVGSAIGVGGELVALVEELPRLKTAIAGMPATINAAGQALGLGGGAGLIGALGAAGLAVGAFTLVMGKLREQAEKDAEVMRSAIDISRDVNQLIAGGGTVEDAQSRIEQLRQQIEAEQLTIGDTLEAQAGFIESRWVPAFARTSQQYKDFNTEIENSEQAIAGLEFEIRKLEEAIQSGELTSAESEMAIQQVTQAEQQLAQVRADTTEQTRTQSREVERQAQVERVRVEAVRDNTRELEQAQKAQEDYNKSIADFANERAKINRDTQDALEDLRYTFARDLTDSLQDASTSASDNLQDALADGNFLGVKDIKRDYERQQRDILTEADRNRRDQLREIRINNDRQLRELQIRQQQELQVLRQGTSAIVNEFGRMVSGMMATMNPNINPATASGFSAGSSGGGASMSFNIRNISGSTR